MKRKYCRKAFYFCILCQNATIYIYRWIYVMWTYVHREFFFTIFGQCINELNYKVCYLTFDEQYPVYVVLVKICHLLFVAL